MTAGDRAIGLLAAGAAGTARSPRRTSGSSSTSPSSSALMLRSARLYEERTRRPRRARRGPDQLGAHREAARLGEMALGGGPRLQQPARLHPGPLAAPARAHPGRQAAPVAQGHRAARRWTAPAPCAGCRTFTGIRRDQPAVEVDLNQVVQQVAPRPPSRSGGRTARRTGGRDPVRPTWPRAAAGGGRPGRAARGLVTQPCCSTRPHDAEGADRSPCVDGRRGRCRSRCATPGRAFPSTVREKIFDPFFTTKGPKGDRSRPLDGLWYSPAPRRADHGRESKRAAARSSACCSRSAVSGSVGQPAPPPAAAAAALVSLHCLVVDDEEEVGEVVADILTHSAGHTAVTRARSGQEAVGRLGTERFDVVFTDLAMPGMTSWAGRARGARIGCRGCR